ncbi:MAG: hypothetical protein ACJZ72_09660 [Opitutales bacterium]
MGSKRLVLWTDEKESKPLKWEKTFADFLVWRKDGFASYELATVVDDHLMEISAKL